MKELKDLTEVELKAVAYDIVAGISQAQRNLQFIEAELGKRRNEVKPETPPAS